MRLLRLVVVAAGLAALFIWAGSTHAPLALANYPTGHDNTTNPVHLMSWTHADPNTGDPPGTGGDNYYYLKAYAAGNNVFCEVYTGGDWDIALEDSHKTVLSELHTSGLGGRVYITNATAGDLYMCRIANLGSVPIKDYAELNSGVTGDTTTSDCGGPGPVWDVNFNEVPMEPAPTPGMPVNGCNGHSGAAPYVQGDPRTLPPVDDTFDLGQIVGGTTYSFTTTRSCDITAMGFIGHQGTSGTLNITDSNGITVNGTKWGADTPNPMTMNQEFVGADAGEQPAGDYQVHYTGPTNNQEMYAICGVA